MPALKAVFAQLGSLALLWTIGRSGALVTLSPLMLALAQGGLAAFLSAGFGAPRWWSIIHLLFMPCVVLAAGSGLPAWLYLTAFLVLATIYWTSFRTQVPLFLSNKTTVHRLAASLPDTSGTRVLDIGSGTGSLVRRLAMLRPDWQIEGIETAPAPFFLSKLLARKQGNAHFVRGDFWQDSLASYDVVYAFLSPVPMRALWAKALKDMRAGSLLVSNSFEVPGKLAERVLTVGDTRNTRLYFYRIPEQRKKMQ